MPILANQLNLCDISTDFDKFYNQNQNNLLSLLNQFINIREFIPFSFYRKYYSHFGKKREISLLHISSELRSFCGFLKVPNKSQFSRFKINFLDNLNDLFNELVDITEDLSKEVNPFLASILISDTTKFEAYVTENNPKFYQSQLRKSKTYAKRLAKDNPNSTFDADDNYAYLHRKSIMPIINLNPRNSSDLPQPDFNEIGTPLCPYNSSLPMVYDGITREKGRADRIKYICPKVKKLKVKLLTF